MADTDKSLRQQGPGRTVGNGSLVRKRVLIAAREIENDARIAASCHFSAATFWYTLYYALGLPTSVLAAVAGVAALRNHTVVAAALAIGVAALSAATTFLNAGERAHAHSKKRAQYEELKNAIRFFRTVTVAMTQSDDELATELTRHARTRDTLNRDSPQVRQKFFVRASAAIARSDRQLREEQPESAPQGRLARLVEHVSSRPGRSHA